MKLSEVHNVPDVPVDVELPQGGTLAVRAAVGKITVDDAEAFYLAMSQPGEAGSALAGMLADTLTWWDVQDDDGADVAPTVEVLRALPSVVLGAILTAVMGAAEGPPARPAS